MRDHTCVKASTSTNNKSGSTNEEYVNLLVTVKASQVKDIPNANMFQLKSGTLEEMNDNFRMYKRAVPQLLANRRVSDASSLSSYSRYTLNIAPQSDIS